MTSESKYTSDQWEIVKKINKKRDYYDILGVDKDCSEDELKKAYKKLALKLHPDKNQAPGSTEAFKSVSKAFSALSDPQEKKKYDRGGGGDGDLPSPFYGTPFNFDGYHFSAEDLFAEDVFNLFFGQTNPNFRYRQNCTRTARRRSRAFNASQQHQQQQQPEHPRRQRQQFKERHQHGSSFSKLALVGSGSLPGIKLIQPSIFHKIFHKEVQSSGTAEFINSYNFLVQMSPLLLMVLLSVMNTFFSHEEVYSLKQTEKHTAERRTSRFGISFYLKEGFKEKYEGHLTNIEQQVEDKHVRQLRNDCYRERSARETALWKARMYNNKALFESTRNERLKSCDELQALISSH